MVFQLCTIRTKFTPANGFASASPPQADLTLELPPGIRGVVSKPLLEGQRQPAELKRVQIHATATRVVPRQYDPGVGEESEVESAGRGGLRPCLCVRRREGVGTVAVRGHFREWLRSQKISAPWRGLDSNLWRRVLR